MSDRLEVADEAGRCPEPHRFDFANDLQLRLHRSKVKPTKLTPPSKGGPAGTSSTCIVPSLNVIVVVTASIGEARRGVG